MAMVTVYRYDFYDPVLKRDRRSEDYATPEAIEQRHGAILAETARRIDDEHVDDMGIVRAGAMGESVPAPRPGYVQPLRPPP